MCNCCQNEDRHTSQVTGVELCDECALFLRELIQERNKYKNIVDLLHNQLKEINDMIGE